MQPVSMRRRLVYLILSVLAFMLTVPVAVFYASGYRFEDFSLVETGGVYVTVSASDAIVSINGKEEGTTSLFVRSFYVDRLNEEWYSVQVSREGYYPWVKKLKVEPSIVTDAFAFLIPQTLTLREIQIDTNEEDVASTTRAVSQSEYNSLLKAFVSTSTLPLIKTATSTPVATRAGVELYVEKGNLIARWSRDPKAVPSSFCVEPSSCAQEFAIEKGKETVKNAQFFLGGVVYVTKESGVFLAENDIRPVHLVVPVYSRPGADFRIINGELIIKDGTTYYEVSGF